MEKKQLTDKAISIKGKQYVLVSDRILYFNEEYPNGSIQTIRSSDDNREVFIAKVIPDVENPNRYFTGHSQAIWGDGYINKTSAMENAETSAIGRALGMMGIGVIDSIASVDEIKKAENTDKIQSMAKKKGQSNTDACPNCGTIVENIKHGEKDGRKWHIGKCDCGEEFWIKDTFYMEKSPVEDIAFPENRPF